MKCCIGSRPVYILTKSLESNPSSGVNPNDVFLGVILPVVLNPDAKTTVYKRILNFSYISDKLQKMQVD